MSLSSFSSVRWLERHSLRVLALALCWPRAAHAQRDVDFVGEQWELIDLAQPFAFTLLTAALWLYLFRAELYERVTGRMPPRD